MGIVINFDESYFKNIKGKKARGQILSIKEEIEMIESGSYEKDLEILHLKSDIYDILYNFGIIDALTGNKKDNFIK